MTLKAVFVVGGAVFERYESFERARQTALDTNLDTLIPGRRCDRVHPRTQVDYYLMDKMPVWATSIFRAVESQGVETNQERHIRHAKIMRPRFLCAVISLVYAVPVDPQFPTGRQDLVSIPSYSSPIGECRDDTCLYQMRINVVAIQYSDDGAAFKKF